MKFVLRFVLATTNHLQVMTPLDYPFSKKLLFLQADLHSWYIYILMHAHAQNKHSNYKNLHELWPHISKCNLHLIHLPHKQNILLIEEKEMKPRNK